MSTGSADPAFADGPNVAPLAACPLFAPLPATALRALAELGHRRRYETGEALFRFGDPSDSVFVICSGGVAARVSSSDGRELVLHVAGPGESPGQLDLMDESPRSVDAVAHGGAEVLVLPARAARRVLLEHPAALLRLSAELATIIRTLSESAGDLVFLGLPARIAKLLLARPAVEGRVELGITQGELAAQLGVARQSLNRALSELQRRGLIRVVGSGTTIDLLDRMTLRRLAVGDRRALSPE